jgi:pyruvate/2-oxoglutarate dehydrogenase complex dihydrolipoamide dehydrogenase (E3) component
MKKYNAVIIGTGQSGSPLANALADKGWKVAVIEEKYVGGTCINYGCTPTKAMVSSAKAAYTAENLSLWGLKTGSVSVDFKAVMKRKDKIVKSFRGYLNKSLESHKNITLIKGTASFIGPKEIEVRLKQLKLTGEYIFVDTGAKPVIPKIYGLNTIKYLTSESILNLTNLPEHLIILGGGYIALEFAQMFRRFGSKVTVIEQNPRFLSREDEDIANSVKEILEDEGIKIYTGAKTNSVKKLAENKFKLSIETGPKNKNLTGSHLLVATGIKPSTEKLNLHLAGIATDEKGFIKVNSRLETSVKKVYAMGDVKGGPAFTHISYDDYRIIYANLVKKEKRTTANRHVPYVLFTDPELGRVGLTEQDAIKDGYKIKTAVLNMRNVARAIEAGETKGMMKAVIDKKSGKILGFAALGMYGGELMSIIETAMIGGLHYSKLKDAVFAHPTLAESLNNLFAKIE